MQYNDDNIPNIGLESKLVDSASALLSSFCTLFTTLAAVMLDRSRKPNKTLILKTSIGKVSVDECSFHSLINAPTP